MFNGNNDEVNGILFYIPDLWEIYLEYFLNVPSPELTITHIKSLYSFIFNVPLLAKRLKPGASFSSL